MFQTPSAYVTQFAQNSVKTVCKFCDIRINKCICKFDVMQNAVKNSVKLV